MSEKSIQIPEPMEADRKRPWLHLRFGLPLLRLVNRIVRMDVVGADGRTIGELAATQSKVILSLKANPVKAANLLSDDAGQLLTTDSAGKLLLRAEDLISTDASNTIAEGTDEKLHAP
jgi:hypothetical protein